ncbi:methyltransferase family protein [Agrococcus jejuensis]|uniref:Protein-S-isoprenylcysteine O-methyltransferase Ste14 n=1 Tax=Agrococcus jejuensis TaxID=399736 RepID=A0A1G8AA46_9MICO|nr:isoprenylcysteine carboxylmethyltransferase family protein [Agrococcus jejuensis]SDH17250.1 Protein-S-isoprenylcysteine O-methyltransferase Ste14 [Agrococcus jejuensis]
MDSSRAASHAPDPRLRTLGRAYFGVQSVAGAAWWLSVFLSPAVQHATLGALPPVAVAAFDLPLFVAASALAAAGIRWSAWIATAWTTLVAVGMAGYATVTQLAGLGAVLMVAAAAASIAAAMLVLLGRIPGELVTRGPFAFVVAPVVSVRAIAARTTRQMLVFWGTFLVVLPTIIALVEARWLLRLDAPPVVQALGVLLFVVASALGIWSARSFAVLGEGTPLPSTQPRRLVVAGPYRWVRNPMAIAGIVQGMAVGLAIGSWMVVVWAAAGSLVWNQVVRPEEEADLHARFGAEYAAYRDRVRCWLPRQPLPPGTEQA